MDNGDVRFSSICSRHYRLDGQDPFHLPFGFFFIETSSSSTAEEEEEEEEAEVQEEDQVEPTRSLQTDTEELAIGSFIPQIRGWDCGHCLKAFYYLQMHWPY